MRQPRVAAWLPVGVAMLLGVAIGRMLLARHVHPGTWSRVAQLVAALFVVWRVWRGAPFR